MLVLLVLGPVAHRPLLLHDSPVDKARLRKLPLVLERTVHRTIGFPKGSIEKLVQADEVAIVWESAVIAGDGENDVLDLDGAAGGEVASMCVSKCESKPVLYESVTGEALLVGLLEETRPVPD